MNKPKIRLKEGGGILKKIGVYAIATVLIAGIVLGAGMWLSEVDVPISYEEPYSIQMSESETDDYDFETIGFKETTEWAEADFEENDEGTQDRHYHQHVRIDNPVDTGHVAVDVEIEEPTGWTDQMGFTVFDGLKSEEDLVEPGDEDIEVEYWGSKSHSEAVPEGETKYFTVVYSLSMDAPEPNDYEVNWNFYEGESVNVPDDYDTIGDAIESVDDYTTIFVESNGNPYDENVEVNKAGITLYGIDNPTVEGSFDLQEDDVTLNGFRIDNEDSELHRNRGVYIDSDAEGVVVSNNIVERNDDFDIRNDGMYLSGQGTEILDNIVEAPGITDPNDIGNGFWTEPSGDLTVRGNTVENYRTSMNFDSGDEGDFTITIEDNDFHPGYRHGISIGDAFEFNDYDFIIEDNEFFDTGETSISDRHNEYTQNRDVEWREAIVENNDEVDGHEWYLEEVDPPRWILGEAPQVGAEIPEYEEPDPADFEYAVTEDGEEGEAEDDGFDSGDIYNEIQDAVDAAGADESILVYPGTYDEGSGVDIEDGQENLEIVSKAGPGETTIEGSNRIVKIREDGVTLKGFELDGDAQQAVQATGVSDIEILHNEIPDEVTAHSAIDLQETDSVLVEYNVIDGQDADGAEINAVEANTDIEIVNNEIEGGIAFSDTSCVLIEGNTITDYDEARPQGILLSDFFGDVMGVEIRENEILDKEIGLDIRNEGAVDELSHNNFIENDLGVVYDVEDPEEPLDATYNWWGQTEDIDDLIEGEVDYEPWLDDEMPYGAPVYYE